jgi:membrane associated rhomboid family serine protease
MMQRLTPVVKFLLIANLAIFLADVVIFDGAIRHLGAFTVATALMRGHIWEFITFQFLHASLGHVAFNMIGLYFFGPFLENWWGKRRFIAFYLLCGIGGAAFYSLLLFAGVLPAGTTSLTPLVGASAGIYGILIGVAVIAPNTRVALLLPPIELSIRQLAMGVLVIAALSILLRFGNEGGEAGHLGGAMVGYLLMRRTRLLAWAESRDPEVVIVRPKAFTRRSEPKLRPRSEIDLTTQSEVDEILDKISRDGFQSLTPAEREILNKAAKSNRRNS